MPMEGAEYTTSILPLVDPVPSPGQDFPSNSMEESEIKPPVEISGNIVESTIGRCYIPLMYTSTS